VPVIGAGAGRCFCSSASFRAGWPQPGAQIHTRHDPQRDDLSLVRGQRRDQSPAMPPERARPGCSDPAGDSQAGSGATWLGAVASVLPVRQPGGTRGRRLGGPRGARS
jgi:hypothetical protein